MPPLQEGLVYGPVRSRRLGHSLGVNVFPRNLKLCTFNCTYCQYGWTRAHVRDATATPEQWPSPATIAKAVAQRLERLVARRETMVDRLTLAGNGEPTLHPRFGEVVSELAAVRDRLAPGLPLAILSNSGTLDLPGVVEGLNAVDERYMKLDAGDATLLRRVNAAPVAFEAIVAGLKRLRDIVIQSMFVKDRLGRIDNATDLAIGNWVGTLQAIRPAGVHIYSIDRAPAWPYLQAIPVARLEEIARRARAAGLNADVFASTVVVKQAIARHA